MTNLTYENCLSILEKKQSEGYELFMRKNADYGDSFATFGILGVIVRMQDKISRIINLLTIHTTSQVNESIADTSIDLFNYSTMALMLINEKRNIEKNPSRETQMKNTHEKAMEYFNNNKVFFWRAARAARQAAADTSDRTDLVDVYKAISQNTLNQLHLTHECVSILDIKALELSLLQSHVFIGLI